MFLDFWARLFMGNIFCMTWYIYGFIYRQHILFIGNIFYMMEYRDIFVILLKKFDESRQSR